MSENQWYRKRLSVHLINMINRAGLCPGVVAGMVAGLVFGVAGVSYSAEPPTTAPLSKLVEHPLRSAPATAVSLNNTVLSAQIQARVDSIPVGVSQQVEQGETLLKLDCTDYGLALQRTQAGVSMATARLTLANTQQDRAKQLLGKNLASRENVDTANAEAISRQGELDQARIAEQQAQQDVKRCTITAPFDGIVTERMASVGQLAAVGTPLLAITDAEHLEVSAQVKPQEVDYLKHSTLTFEADQAYPVTLLRVGGTVNSETRDQEIRLSFNGAKPPPGTAGKLRWHDPRAFIPPRYVVQRDGQLGLFIKRDGQARFQPLPNAIPGRRVAVDLPADTEVVNSALGQMKSGDPLP